MFASKFVFAIQAKKFLYQTEMVLSSDTRQLTEESNHQKYINVN